MSYFKIYTITYFQPFNTNDIMQYSPSTHFILVKTRIIIKQSLFKYEQQISFFTQYHSSRYSQCIQAMSKMKLFTNFLLRNELQLCIIIKEQVREKELPLVILLHSDFYEIMFPIKIYLYYSFIFLKNKQNYKIKSLAKLKLVLQTHKI